MLKDFTEKNLRRHNFCDGYVAEDPRYIVIPEAYASYQPRYRPILSEELCHAILEYDILGNGCVLPPDAKPHTLTEQQHIDIEGDAGYLSLAVLFPKNMFIERFKHHLGNMPDASNVSRDKHLTDCAKRMESDFDVWSLKAAYRMRDLKLITDAEFSSYFEARLPFGV